MRRLALLALILCLGTASCGSAGSVTSAGTTATTAAPAESGVDGQISVGPTCPAAQVTTSCTAPLAAPVRLINTRGAAVASGHSDSAGRYRLPAPAGRYDVVVTTTSPGRGCLPAHVEVVPGRWARVDVMCDTGIR